MSPPPRPLVERNPVEYGVTPRALEAIYRCEQARQQGLKSTWVKRSVTAFGMRIPIYVWESWKPAARVAS